MEIEISTSDPESVDPFEIAAAIELTGLRVLSVSVNEGERHWEAPDLDRCSRGCVCTPEEKAEAGL